MTAMVAKMSTSILNNAPSGDPRLLNRGSRRPACLFISAPLFVGVELHRRRITWFEGSASGEPRHGDGSFPDEGSARKRSRPDWFPPRGSEEVGNGRPASPTASIEGSLAVGGAESAGTPRVEVIAPTSAFPRSGVIAAARWNQSHRADFDHRRRRAKAPRPTRRLRALRRAPLSEGSLVVAAIQTGAGRSSRIHSATPEPAVQSPLPNRLPCPSDRARCAPCGAGRSSAPPPCGPERRKQRRGRERVSTSGPRGFCDGASGAGLGCRPACGGHGRVSDGSDRGIAGHATAAAASPVLVAKHQRAVIAVGATGTNRTWQPFD